MLRVIDSMLNDFTSYRIVLYGLIGLLAIACLLGFTGAISISVGPLIVSIILLLISCYATNKAFSVLLKVPGNTESWIISALILACLLPPAAGLTQGLYTLLAGLLAMASKFLITYRGTHIFNPVAFGAFVLSITGVLPAIWWIATPWLTPFTLLLAFAVLRKQRRFQVFFVFAAAAIAMLVLTSTVLQGDSLMSVLHSSIVSWPIIFFGSIMLTEPATLPPTHYYRMFFAVIVGLLFASELHIGRLTTTPQAVLLFGNLLTVLAVPAFGVLLKLKGIRKLSPDIYEVSFSRPTNAEFTAGQYAELTLAHPHVDSRGDRRTFSIVSSPAASDIRFTFRSSDKGSSFKSALTKSSVGAVLRLSHIAGDFTMPHDIEKPLLFIAGGVGITPFHSMIESLDTRRDIVLIYCASDPKNFIYTQDFDAASSQGVRTIYLQDKLTPETVKELVPDFKQRLIYVSGPDGMVSSSKKMLSSIGVPLSKIKSDYFAGY